MLALYRSGRQADALAAYRQLRRTLDDELGIDPSRVIATSRPPSCARTRRSTRPRLAVTQATDPGRGCRSRAAAAGRAGVRRAPGRAGQLDELLPRTGHRAAAPPAVVISAMSGTAGVGKTALAVHWAHRVAAQFPDGQLYVNLRGFDPAGPADASPGRCAGIPRGPRRPAGPHPGRAAGARPRSTAACWPASACWSCSTTPATPTRSARCCPARPAAWSW